MNSEIAYLLYQRLLLVQSGTVISNCEGQNILGRQEKKINLLYSEHTPTCQQTNWRAMRGSLQKRKKYSNMS